MIQDARKEAGLEVTDRIELAVETSGEPAEALAPHRDEIAAETLATSWGRARSRASDSGSGARRGPGGDEPQAGRPEDVPTASTPRPRTAPGANPRPSPPTDVIVPAPAPRAGSARRRSTPVVAVGLVSSSSSGVAEAASSSPARARRRWLSFPTVAGSASARRSAPPPRPIVAGSATGFAGSAVGRLRGRGPAATASRRAARHHRPQFLRMRLHEPPEVLEEPLLAPEERLHRSSVRRLRGRRSARRASRGPLGRGGPPDAAALVLRDQAPRGCRSPGRGTRRPRASGSRRRHG